MQLSELYHECHSHGHNHLAEGAADGWDEVVERIARGLHDGTLKPTDLDTPTLKRTAKQLMNAVFKGAGTNFDDPDLSGDQYDLLQKFEKNIYYFSGFKNYQQLKEANELLLDENRNIRPFSEFLQLVKKINTKYNVNYLSAEYGHAVASAQMATKWQEIQAQQEDLPFLQYDTVGDDRVRDEHRGIDGVIRRVDDDFWKTWYPPNGWNCRCSVRQLDDATETPVADIVYPELLPMFRTNVGMSEVVFPSKHPYIINTTSPIRKKIAKKADEATPSRPKKKAITFNDITEVNTLIKKYADDNPADFARGFDVVDATKRKSFLMCTNTRGRITLNNRTFKVGDEKVNAYKDFIAALNKIESKKKLTFQQEYSIESFWHEILHNKAVKYSHLSKGTQKQIWMETINQFVARHTYPAFMKSLGGEAQHQDKIIENGYRYKHFVSNFRLALEKLKIKESDVLDDLQKILLKKEYAEIKDNVAQLLRDKEVDNVTVGKVISMIHESEEDFATIFKED